MLSSEPKWAAVSTYCMKHGVNRGAVQCRKRWSNLAGDYKKIREWEAQRKKDETESFWVMRNDLRRERKLPGFFDKEVYDIMEAVSAGSSPITLALAPPTTTTTMIGGGGGPEGLSDEVEKLFDSRQGPTDDGLFSDYEQEESGRSPEKDVQLKSPATATGISAPLPISEKLYKPMPQACQGQGMKAKKWMNKKAFSIRGKLQQRKAKNKWLCPCLFLLRDKIMAAREARTGWQHRSNYCFVHGDVRSAQRFSRCPSSSFSKESDCGNENASNGGREVHSVVMSSVQTLAKALSCYQDEVLIKREELLQLAQNAISGLKLNADVGRIDAEACSLREELDKLMALQLPISEICETSSEKAKDATVELNDHQFLFMFFV